MAKIPPRVIAIAVTAAAAVATPFIGGWEGLSRDPYTDLAGYRTVCYGETRVNMRRYSDAECLAMLNKAVEEFANQVLQCTPELAYHPYALAAVTSGTYNIGLQRYCTSTAAKLFKAGDIRGGCNAMSAYNGVTYEKPRTGLKCRQLKSGKWFCEIPGLVNRRKAERQLCLTGL